VIASNGWISTIAMHILVFEDARAADLEPVTLCRPASAISCGTYTLLDQLQMLGGRVASIVRPHLADVAAADDPPLVAFADWHREATQSGQKTLFANARLVPSAANRAELEDLVDGGQAGIVHSTDGVVAALVPADQLPAVDDLTVDRLAPWLAACELPKLDARLAMLDYPHDVIRHHLATMEDNLADRLGREMPQEVANAVFAPAGFKLGPHVATDTSAGPIVIKENVELGPFSFLEGPLYVGRGARIREHASVQQFTSLGHNAKIGGEVEASIIEPFSNKQHYGFLGHSYVGSWVNLGAGTCTSDLKNTYGTIRVRRDGERIDTQMQFLGAIVGDFAKTAINSSIFTGKTIGVASFIYGTATEDVPSFVNYARVFGQVTGVSVDAVVRMQQRMFARRGIQQRPCDITLLEAVHAMTEPARRGFATKTGPPQF
jgi:glucose-1-phosphate thymidylyltransferase